MGKKSKSKAPAAVFSIPGSNHSTDVFVYQNIFDAILAQSLLPGTKLVEDDLAGIFKVSRTTVRRALVRLTHDGIVNSVPNHGCRVVKPTVDQAREVLAARRLIEGAIVAEVAGRLNSENAEALRQLVESEQREFDSDHQGSGLRLSGDFHMQLAQFSGNKTLSQLLKGLIPLTSLIIAQYEKPGHSTCSHKEHFDLIDIIEQGKVERSVAMMESHLENIELKLDLTESTSTQELSKIFSNVLKTTA